MLTLLLLVRPHRMWPKPSKISQPLFVQDDLARASASNDVIRRALQFAAPPPSFHSPRSQHIASTPEQVRAIDDFVAAVNKCYRLPGHTISLVQNDEVIYAKGFGFRDDAKTQPVDADTLFHIGSTSKAFTSTLFAMLVDQGKAKWDAQVMFAPRVFASSFCKSKFWSSWPRISRDLRSTIRSQPVKLRRETWRAIALVCPGTTSLGLPEST